MALVRAKQKRSYSKGARAKMEAQTRNRILDAVVALHEDVGPLRTTIKAIAERAGVQRLTVYRHFPVPRELIAACSARWGQRLPLPDLWPSPDRHPRRRARELLLALYQYYRSGERMLTKVIHDAPEMPELQAELAPFSDYLAALVNQLERAWSRKSARRRATLRHATGFSAWRSLAGLPLTDQEAVDLVFHWCDAVRTQSHPRGANGISPLRDRVNRDPLPDLV